jgi:hypothetical protein
MANLLSRGNAGIVLAILSKLADLCTKPTQIRQDQSGLMRMTESIEDRF